MGVIQNNMKYQNPFLAEGEPYVHSYLGMEDPYDVKTDDKLRYKWAEEVK